MNFIGVDVSKQKLDCALLIANPSGKLLHKVVPKVPKVFRNCWPGLRKRPPLHLLLCIWFLKPPARTMKSQRKLYSTRVVGCPWSTLPTLNTLPKASA
jgi:hypothetical protein